MRGTIPEQITAADLKTLNEGLRFFFWKLRLASGLFRQSGEEQRHAAIIAMDAAWRFVALFSQPYAPNFYFSQSSIYRLHSGI